MSDNSLYEEFPVGTWLPATLGWSISTIGAIGLLVLFFEFSAKMLFIFLILLAVGIYFIRASRNVKKIVITSDSIKYLPIGKEIAFSEIERLHVPSWADRWDARPGSVGHLRLDTKIEKIRWVPGAFANAYRQCRINTVVKDDQKLIALLRERIPE